MSKKTIVEKHFDEIAGDYDFYTKKRELHYSTLKILLKSLIPSGKHVFEVGCGTGDILKALNPSRGYGMDISSSMIKIANEKYSKNIALYFSTRWPTKKFDYIFMSDVIEHLEKPEETFKQISKLMGGETKFINTMMNPIWEPVETVYNLLGWKMPEGPHKRLGYKNIKILINGAGMKIVRHDYKLLMPIKIPLVTNFMNNYLEKYLKRFAFIEYFVAVKV